MATYTGNAASNYFDYLGTESLVAYGNGGNDTLIGNTNNDVLFGGRGNDYLDGFSGNDYLNGGFGSDTLIGGAGNDTLDGGFGNDLMVGGTGNDFYVVDSVSDLVVENAGEGIDTVVSSINYTLGDNLEGLTLTGNAIAGVGNTLDNILIGNNANNILYGLAGNDVFNGGLGVDTLIGGTGNDVYYVDTATDVIVEDAGEGIDAVVSSVNYTLGNNLENLILTDSAFFGVGNTLDNTLIGNNANNQLYGLAGNDVLDGGLGVDTLIGGTGNDVYYVDTATDVVIENFGEGIDTVVSSISYTLGDNLDNLLLIGSDAVNGVGNSLNNSLTGNAANNILSGLAGNDALSGGAGNDTLLGGSGNDLLVGGDGNDRLDGYATTGTEYDTLAGGAGVDTFILGGSWGVSYQGNGYALITDWNSSSDYIEARGSASQYTFRFGDFGIGGSASDTAIYYTGNGGSDLIALVQDSNNVSFTRDFRFV
jgi:serralysin